MFKGIDFDKVRTLHRYYGKACLKLTERDKAREDLNQQLKKLKNIADKNLENEFVILESKISDALNKEKQILQHQKEEDLFHAKLREKIHALDLKLDQFLKSSESRSDRIKEVEERVKEHFKTKKKRISEIKEDLKLLETLKNELKKEDKHNSRLKLVEQKIKDLKIRLKKMEKV